MLNTAEFPQFVVLHLNSSSITPCDLSSLSGGLGAGFGRCITMGIAHNVLFMFRKAESNDALNPPPNFHLGHRVAFLVF